MPGIRIAAAVLSLLATPVVAQDRDSRPDPRQRFADLGTCALVSGAKIRDCRIGYRVYGTPSPARDNTVLIPTWFAGHSGQWESELGAAGLVDSTRYHVVVVDALGNGVSSSPSNSRAQSGTAFPRITIRDMVASQHRLLTERLGITHLRAVVGTSMGGMQAFEWAVSYPDFADRLVSLVGTPLPSSYDRVLWESMLSTIENGRRYRVPADTVAATIGRLFVLVLTTPRRLDAETPRDSVAAVVKAHALGALDGRTLDDLEAQLRAMLSHDVSARFGGDLARAARAVRAKLLVVYSPDDHTVSADPSRAFARLLPADTLSVPSDCGHLAPGCERRVAEVVRAFLSR